jgi:hypothetical protein
MRADVFEITGLAVIDRRYSAIFSHVPHTVFLRFSHWAGTRR